VFKKHATLPQSGARGNGVVAASVERAHTISQDG
jgi:hypothetical protein